MIILVPSPPPSLFLPLHHGGISMDPKAPVNSMLPSCNTVFINNSSKTPEVHLIDSNSCLVAGYSSELQPLGEDMWTS